MKSSNGFWMFDIVSIVKTWGLFSIPLILFIISKLLRAKIFNHLNNYVANSFYLDFDGNYVSP